MALALALTAQSLFTQQPFVIRATESWSADVRFDAAVGLLLAAMACFAVTTFGAPLEADEPLVVASRQDKGFRALGPYLAAGCYILSLLVYVAVGENLLVRFFWLAGVALLVASQLKGPASESLSEKLDGDVHSSDSSRLPTAEVVTADNSHTRSELSRAVRWEWGLVAVITVVAFGLRYWRLASLPSDIDGDIASVGLQVLEIIHGSAFGWVGVGWSNHSLVFYQLAALSMRLFGQNLYGLMMGSVIAGTLAIPAIFLLGREMFGRRVGLVAAMLLAISYSHIHFSRVVFTETASLQIILLFYFLFRGLRTQQRRWFVFAGIALGWGSLAYYSSRVGPVIMALLGMWLFLWKRRAIMTHARNWVAFGLGALLGFGPQLGFAIGNFTSLVGRGNVVTLASPGVRAHLMGKYGIESAGELLVEQVKRSFLVYHAYRDTSSLVKFPGPMLDVLTAALLVLGLGYCLARLRNPKHFTLIVWIVSTLVLGGVLMNDPPYWPHLAITLPAVVVVAGLATVQAWEALARPMGRVGQWGIGTLLVVTLVYTGIHNWQTYYDYVRDNAGERVRIIRYATSLPAGYQVRLVTTSISWRDREFQFLARGVAGQDLAPDQLRSDPRPCRDAPIVFILTHDYVDVEPLLQARCPGGQSQQHIEPGGRLSFVSYRLGSEGVKPSVVVSSEVRIDPLVWVMMGGWALVLVLTVWLYYRFVVRRVLAKRALKQMAKPIAPQVTTPGGISQVASWRSSLDIFGRRLRQGPVLRGLSDELPGQRDVLSLQATAAPRLQDWLQQMSEWTPPRLTKSQARKAAIVWGIPLAALALAYVAQSIFAVGTNDGFGVSLRWLGAWPESSRLWLGVFIYLAAMVAWMIFAPDLHATENTEPAASPALPKSYPSHSSRLKAWSLLTLLASLVCYAPAMILFGLWGESSLVRWLWAGGVILFVVSALLGLRARRSTHPDAQTSPHFGWIHVAILVAILSAAFWLRFYQLDKIPSDFHGDMASYGLNAREYLLGAEQRIFLDGWANLSRMAFLPSAVFMQLFGNNLFGLQLTAVVGGMITLLGFYLLVWRVFDRHRLAALATSLVAINIVHIHFSRIAAYMDPWLFSLPALFLFVDGLKARRLSSLALAGVLMGFCIEMYYSGRVVFLIVGVFLLYAFLFQRRWVTQNWTGLGLLTLGFLVAFGPNLIYYAHNWNAFIERSREVWLYEPDVMRHLQNKYQISSAVGVTLRQLELSLLMFHHSMDSSTQFGFPHPMFNSLVSPLIVLGLGYGLRRWRSPGVVLMLAWLFLVIVVGSALTVDAPFWPRLVSVVLPAALLAALALDQLWSLADKLKGRWAAWVLGAVVALLLIQVGWQTWDLYYETVRDNAHPRARIGRFLSSLPPQVAACSFLNPYELEVREIQFLAWPRKLADLPSDAPDDALGTCPGPPMAWILTPNHLDRLDALQMRWPGGITQEHHESNGDLAFTSYLVGYQPVSGPVGGTEGDVTASGPMTLVVALAAGVFLIWLMAYWIAQRWNVRGATGAAPPTEASPSSLVEPPRPVSQSDTAPTMAEMLRGSAVGRASARLNQWLEQLGEWQPPALKVEWTWKGTLIWAGPLAAVCLAYLAQAFYDISVAQGIRLFGGLKWLSEAARLWLGTAVYVAAMLVWVLTTPTKNSVADARFARCVGGGRRDAWPTNFQIIVRGLGVLCSAVAMILFALQGEGVLMRWLWAGGVLLFIASWWSWHTARRPAAPEAEASPPFRRINVAMLGVILAVGFGLRVYRLTTLPLELSTDMASYGLVAREYVLGMQSHIVGVGWFYLPRLAFLPYAASMWLFGNNLFGLYMMSVIMGTLNLLTIYLLVWRTFDRHRLAALATAITAIHAGHIEYSRIAGFMDAWFFGYLALLLVVDGLRARRTISLAVAGVLVGLCLQTYPASRIIVPILAVMAAYAYFFRRAWVTENRSGLGWLVVGALIAIGPNLVYFGHDWQMYIQRAREVSLFDPDVITHLKYTYNTDSFIVVVWEQIKHSLLMFHYYTDNSAHFRYPHPMFNSFISPLLVLGLGYGLLRWRKPGMALVLSSFGLILVLGGVMTVNTPTWSRLVGIMPLAALLIAVPLDQGWDILASLKGESFVSMLVVGVSAFVIVVGVKEWSLYYEAVRDYARPVVRVGRYLNTLPPQVAACGTLDSYSLDWAEVKFMAWPRTLLDVSPDAPDTQLDACPGPPFVWVLSPKYAGRLDAVQARWPGGITQEHRASNDDLLFTSYLFTNSPTGQR